MPRDRECPKCGGSLFLQDEDPDTGIVGGWVCEDCDYSEAYEDEPPEPDLNAKSFRETYIEAWNEHQRLHKR